MLFRRLTVAGALAVLFLPLSVEAQRTVRISKAEIRAPEGATEAIAYATIENGTMYDAYVVTAETDFARAELLDASSGKAVPAKEVLVPAFGQLAMGPKAVHIKLAALKRPLKAGETVALTLKLDDGTALTADALVH